METGYGFLALVPPVVAISLCFATKQVLISMFAGLFAGSLIMSHWNPFAACAFALDKIAVNMSGNIVLLLFTLFMGVGISFIWKLGGSFALAAAAKKRFKKRHSVCLGTWGLGIACSVNDCLAAAMDACGYNVTREFYINDAGNQIEKFGLSLEARYLQIFKGEDAVEFPEDGYHGEDIKERAQQYADVHGDSLLNVSEQERRQALVDFALPKNIEKLRTDLEKYRIVYDVWFPESTLHQSGAVKAVVDDLTKRGLTYEKDGAVWYKATEFGGEKDEVLIRANGNPTYFTADIAYHKNKFADRHFDRVINVWGADHHGHVARLKGAMDAIGLDGSKLDIVLMQLVRLMKDGEPYRMSKRTGKSITLSDLTDLVPIDAARFFFNMREPNSTLDFDLDLAVEESSQNPVYYVQYAHARICSILKNLSAQGIQPRECTAEELTLLSKDEERELIRKLAQCPQEIINAAKNYDPARLTHYLMDVATLFHKFYNACRVQGEDAST